MNLDLEFAWTTWEQSCKDEHPDRADRACRRPKHHTEDHASGFGSQRLTWAARASSGFAPLVGVQVRFPDNKRAES